MAGPWDVMTEGIGRGMALWLQGKQNKKEQSRWEREQQLREQAQLGQRELLNIEKQRAERESRQWSPGETVTKPTPAFGMGGPVGTYREEIPEGPEYMKTRLQSELASKNLANVRTPEELAQLESDIRTAEEGRRAGAAEEADVLGAGRATQSAIDAFNREKERLGLEHGYRMQELALGVKPPKEAEEPLIKPDGTVNIKHFFDAANTLFPGFTFYDLTDPKMIENAKKKIYDIVISRFAPTREEQAAVATALDQWFNSLFEIAKNTPDANKWKKVDWKGLVSTWSQEVGGKQVVPLHPSVLKAGEPSPIPKPEETAKKEGLLRRGLKRAGAYIKGQLTR